MHVGVAIRTLYDSASGTAGYPSVNTRTVRSRVSKHNDVGVSSAFAAIWTSLLTQSTKAGSGPHETGNLKSNTATAEVLINPDANEALATPRFL